MGKHRICTLQLRKAPGWAASEHQSCKKIFSGWGRAQPSRGFVSLGWFLQGLALFLWEKGSIPSHKCSELAVVGWVWNMLVPELLSPRPPAEFTVQSLKKSQI